MADITFRGDNAALVGCIRALLALDAKGALVPHCVGGHARDLLTAAAARLDKAAQAGQQDSHAEFEQAFPVSGGAVWNGTDYEVRDGYENSYTADRFVGQWRAWQAGRASVAAGSTVATRAGAVPDGYVLVPREPTGMMKDAGAGVLPLSAARPWHAADCYRSMLSAAPTLAASLGVVRTQAARDVLAERQRQIDSENYDHAHDDEHVNDEIAAMAALYVMPEAARDWDASSTGYGATLGDAMLPMDWNEPRYGERRRQLVKGAAMVLAEVERLDRAAASSAKKEGS